MKKIAFLTTMMLFALSLAGCQTLGDGAELASKREILSSMGQGLLGSSLGDLKKGDSRKALETEYKALEYTNTGDSVSWVSKDEQSRGTVTPGQPYQVGTQNCRQYTHSFVIYGVPQTKKGSACRNENGSWSPLS